MKILLSLLIALLTVTPALAQSVRADRFTLNTGPCTMRSGSGTPEGAVTGNVCDTFWRTDTGVIYSKISGTGNTGWTTSGGVSGSGTTGYLSQWTGSTSLGNGPLASNVPLLNAANVFTANQTINGATVGSALWFTRVASSTIGVIGASGGLKGTGAVDLGFFAETGKAINFMVNGNATDALTIPATGATTTARDVNPFTNYLYNLGDLSHKYLTLHAAELWVETLVAADVMATIGGRVVVGPTTTLTVPMASTDSSFNVKHNQMAVGDRVRLEINGKLEFMAITVGPTANPPFGYAYNVTRNLDGTGANDWDAGDAILNTGTTGDGFIDLYSVSGVLSGYGPTIVGNVRTGTTYSSVEPRWAIGNLNGLYGYGADTYGAAFGTSSAAWIKIDPTNGISIGHNATTKISLDASGNATFTGTITASAGNIAGWSINTDSLRYDTGTAATSAGMMPTEWPFYAGATYAGRATAPFRVSPAGAVTATSGFVGGWTIDANNLYTGSGATRVGMGSASTIAIWAGSNTDSAAPFRVTNAGALTATNATITGAITATSGSFTGNGSGVTNITGGNITTGSVTTTQIAANTITAADIAASTITTTEIAANTITAGDMNVSTLSAISADLGSVTAGQIVVGSSQKLWLNDGGDGVFAIGGTTKATAPFHIAADGMGVDAHTVVVSTLLQVTGGSGEFNSNGTARFNGATFFPALAGSGNRFLCLDNIETVYVSGTTCDGSVPNIDAIVERLLSDPRLSEALVRALTRHERFQ